MSAGQADLVAKMKGWRDAKLDALDKEMNSSTGDAKTNAIAAVVNELVSQRLTAANRFCSAA